MGGMDVEMQECDAEKWMVERMEKEERDGKSCAFICYMTRHPDFMTVGTVVWGRWTNNQYYKGKVDKVDSKIHIVCDDGDRIEHSPSDVTAIILDTTPNPESVTKGSRVIAEWPRRSTLYPGTVVKVDRNNPYKVRYYVHYDDGDKGWVVMNQLRLIPAPGPSAEAQFSVVQVGGNVVALRNIAYPQYFLGVNGDQLFGKFSPFGQTYQAEHQHTGGYPAPTPSYPSPFPYEGGYPQPGGGRYPPAHPPGGYPGGYPTGPSAPPAGAYPTGHHPPPPPGGYPTGPYHPSHGGHYPPSGTYQPPGWYPGYGAPPPYQ
ncbi:hypothetical protein QZH41_000563 [Actinostola sp. cb2023]|nr:hypothetical protein QZH41_000563 [Actinostola sp. cb2023]